MSSAFDVSNLLQNINILAATAAAASAATLTIYKLVLNIRKNRELEQDASATTLIPRKGVRESLTRHSLFRTLLRMRSTIINRLDLGSEVRTALFKDIMVHKIDVWAEKLLKQAEIIDGKCSKECNGDCVMEALDLVKYNKDILAEGIDHYSCYFESDPGYTDDEKQMLRYSVNLFNSQHSAAVATVTGVIDSIVTNARYGYCAKMYQADILSAYEIGMKMMLDQTCKALSGCNGFYTNKTFRLRSYSIPAWKDKL